MQAKREINKWLLYTMVKAVFSLCKKVAKYKGSFSMDYRERGSHARGVYTIGYIIKKLNSGSNPGLGMMG